MNISNELIKKVEASNRKVAKYKRILKQIKARKEELTTKEDEVLGWILEEERRVFTLMNNLSS